MYRDGARGRERESGRGMGREGTNIERRREWKTRDHKADRAECQHPDSFLV